MANALEIIHVQKLDRNANYYIKLDFIPLSWQMTTFALLFIDGFRVVAILSETSRESRLTVGRISPDFQTIFPR